MLLRLPGRYLASTLLPNQRPCKAELGEYGQGIAVYKDSITGWKPIITMPWSCIKQVTVEVGPPRVTAGRVLALGVLALAAKKTDVIVHIETKTQGPVYFRVDMMNQYKVAARVQTWEPHLTP